MYRCWLPILLSYAFIFDALADTSDFGASGLIKMPSARMAADGTLRATISKDELADNFNITFQALPRVQATFRYTIFDRDGLGSGSDPLRDRSYGVKAQLLPETHWLPAVAVGMRDILGTGAWQGEYLVASKAWNGLDATLGLGWGRLGSRSSFSNPLGLISDRFDERPERHRTGGSFGGKSRYGSFFRGDAAIFGGLTYRLSNTPVTFIAEYESDQYDNEVDLGILEKRPAGFNFGLDWEPVKNVHLRVSWLRGDTLGITFSSQVDAKESVARKYERRGRIIAVDENTGLPPGYDPSAWYDHMVFAAEQSGLYLKKAYQESDDSKTTVVIENRSYNLTADALNQIMSLSEIFLPAHISSVDILLEEEGMVGPTVNYTLQREPSRGSIRETVARRATGQIELLAPRELEEVTNKTDFGYPKLGFGLDLGSRVQLMDPDDAFRKQLYARLTSRLQLSDHANFWMRYEQNIYNDFSTNRAPDSPYLPNVRTLINHYLVDGESGIEQFYGEYKRSLSGSVHSRIYAGILEQMYGGIGGEVLYAPYRQRWALGFNVNAVKQRGFERNFKFREYETVTGHLSAYYAAPFFDLDIAVHAGRYLAKDRGYTLEVRRTFDNGFSIGGFFTRTNVSAAEFGEGSFDKGLFFRIPFNGFLPGNSRSSYSTILRPLERDGGRRLEYFGTTLWFDRRALRYDALQRNLERMRPR